jgi:hypothetical protein
LVDVVALRLDVIVQVGVRGLHPGDVTDQGIVGEVDGDIRSLAKTSSILQSGRAHASSTW